jgi:kumamolisin
VGDADPDTGYNILVDGQQMVVGGTSAVAPLMAGLIVLLNQSLNRRLGFANPAFYGVEHLNCFRDITVGDNGTYSAGFGWDPCTGLGVAIGAQLLQALETTTAATQQGQLQTQSHKAEHAHAGSK